MNKILTDDVLGKNLRRIRNSCGLSQEQTISKLNLLGSPLSRSTYSLIELGRCNLFVSDLVGLQKVFGVDYSEFFKGISPAR